SAFWVFTYANKILDALFRNYIERRDYKHAKEVNGLIITFENWIITKGIIRSFTAAEIKSNTKNRAKAALESAKIKDMVLAKLCNSDYDFEIDNLVSRNDINFFEKVYYLI